MKCNGYITLVGIILNGFLLTQTSHAQCPVGDSTQSGNMGNFYTWGGTTASVVTVVQLTTLLNNTNEPVVISQTNTNASPFQITMGACSLTEQTFQRWLKNGGYTSDGSNVGDYVAMVQLTFTNPIRANEMFIALTDMDARGVSGTAPDGFIRFDLSGTTSNATPADFEMVALNSAGNPIMNQVTAYNADGFGGIDFGISATDTAANKYIALIGADTATVKAINIFVRNISDDIGIYIGSIGPNNVLSLGITDFTGSHTEYGNILNWTVADETRLSKFTVEKSSDGKDATFTEIGNVPSFDKRNYAFTDVNDVTGKHFYRLKMIEKNGTNTYSPVIFIEDNKTYVVAKITPNPATGNTFRITNIRNIEAVKLYDYTGRFIGNLNFSLVNDGCNVSIPDAFLRKGLYVVKYRYKGNNMGNAKLLIE